MEPENCRSNTNHLSAIPDHTDKFYCSCFQRHVAGGREYMLRGVLADAEIGLDSNIHSIAWSSA